VTDINETLFQLIQCLYEFVHSLLHNTPTLIHWIQVWTVQWPEIRTNGIQCFSL